MRIAHVTATFPPYWGGTGNVAYHNARLMHERGHEITVFTAAGGAQSLGEEESEGFCVVRLGPLLNVGNAPLTPRLVGSLKDFDIIHLHHAYIFGAEMAVLAARLYTTPLIVTYHNKLRARRGIRLPAFAAYNLLVEPLLFRTAQRICTVEEDHFTSLHSRYIGSPKLVHMPNGVDTRVFRPADRQGVRRQLGTSDDTPVVLFVGALDSAHWFKNVHGLLEAFSDPRLDGSQLLVCGDGDLRPRLERYAMSLGVTDRVRFLGSRRQSELPPIYSAADVTVLPSIDVESFGLVLIESMACGTPVIASDLPGVRAVVNHGVDGYLVPPGDSKALADAVAHVLRDPDRMASMGLNGRNKVVRDYSWERIGDRLENLYRNAAGA